MKNHLMFHKDALLMVAAIGGACLALSSCTMYAPGHVTPNRAQVEHEIYTEKFAVSDMDEEKIKSLAQHYSRYGSGPAAVVVTYDPKTRDMTAMKATEEAARIGSSMRRYGMRDVDARIMPSRSESAGVVLVSYSAYTAHAPKDCGMIAGYNGEDLQYDENYKLGCSVETMLARQVARPKDLAGQNMNDTSMDGRVVSNAVEAYRMGAPNGPLGGESSSGGAGSSGAK